MIQRIQTIYMLLAALALALLFVFPFGTAPSTTEGPLQDGDYDLMDQFVLLLLALFPALLSLGTIFLFKNRKLQMLLNNLSLANCLILMGLASYWSMTISEEVKAGLGLFTPVLAMLFLFLANRAINADDQLVKDSDRLR